MLLLATNRAAEAEPLIARVVRIFSRFQRSTGHEHPYLRVTLENYRQLLALRKLADSEIAARIKAASEGTEKLSPIGPEVERILGPARPVADVLASLDRQYKEQGKPAVYFLKPNDPIAPHLDELLRPNGDGLETQGVAAYRAGAHADAVVLYDAALELMAGQPDLAPANLRTRLNRASAMRELGLFGPAREELSSLVPELDRLPATEALMKGRARYHLALCRWRLGERDAARRSAEESLAAYDGAPKDEPVDPGLRRQSEDLLASLKDGKNPPPLAKVDAPAAIEAARARYRAREALARLPLDQKVGPLLDQALGPARSTRDVLDALDRRYREQGKPPIWFLPLLDERISPRLDQLLGPARTVQGRPRLSRPAVSRPGKARGLVPAARPADLAAPRRTPGQAVEVGFGLSGGLLVSGSKQGGLDNLADTGPFTENPPGPGMSCDAPRAMDRTEADFGEDRHRQARTGRGKLGPMSQTQETSVLDRMLDPLGRCLDEGSARRLQPQRTVRASTRWSSARTDVLANERDRTCPRGSPPPRKRGRGYDPYINADDFIAILKMKARRQLDPNVPA